MTSGLETSYLPSATMGAERPTGQVLEFLTVTSLPHRGVDDEEARRIVRSHAIRDANRRKRLKAGPEARQISGAAPPELPAQSTLTTKFKLNKKPVKDKKEAFLPRNKEWECFLATNTLMRSSRSSLTLALGMGEIDPFDSLAIKLGPKQQAMLDYRKHLYPALIITPSSAAHLLISMYREIPIRAERILYRVEGSPVHLRRPRYGMAEFNPVFDFAAPRSSGRKGDISRMPHAQSRGSTDCKPEAYGITTPCIRGDDWCHCGAGKF